MPRYIDADALTVDLLSYADANKGTYHAEGFKNAVTVVEDQPTADVVEVVRCQDCKYSHPWYAARRICEMWSATGSGVFNDDYCSRGEKGANGAVL